MPPVSGIIAPSSAYTNAPNKEKIPAITHTTVSQIGEPNCPAILAGFINTPEPMILPMIMEVADQKPIFFARDEVVDIIEKEDNEKESISHKVTKNTEKFLMIAIALCPS